MLDRRSETVADLDKASTLEGMHNWQNAAAAYAATRSLGLDNKTIKDAIMNFPGLAHRMEDVGRISGKAGSIRFVNDSKGTNADATRQALKAYENIYWIAGGVAKEGGISKLTDVMGGVKKAYLIGEAASDFSITLSGENINHQDCGTLDRAVMHAISDASSSGIANPIILLSPACASFDQFKNFEIRGNAFRTQVQDIIMRYNESAKSKGQAA